MMRIRIADIKTAVARYFRVDPDYLEGPNRSQTACRMRQVAYKLCRELTDESHPSIGRSFGGRDHSTVVHALRGLERDGDVELLAVVNELKDQLINAAPHSRTLVYAFPFKSRRSVRPPAPVFIRRAKL